MNYQAMGKRVRALRQCLNLTQEQLAQKTNLSPSFLGHIERGSRKASIETLVTLAQVLQVTTDYLLADTLYKNPEDAIRSLKEQQLFHNLMQVIRENRPEW